MTRECSNCLSEKVDESKQTFIYRNWEGLKYDSCLTPICDKCIESGEYVEENGRQRLYLGSDRIPKRDEPRGWWG